MKKLLIILTTIITSLILISCEEEATPADFLTDEDLEELFGFDFLEEEEIGVLDPPRFITSINEVDFFATNQIGELIGNTLQITFISDIGNELILTIVDPANQTFTAGRNSIDRYVVQYTIGDGDAIFSTDLGEDLEESTGTLELTDFSGIGSEVDGTFSFIAFNVNGSGDSVVTSISGQFDNVQVIN